MHFLLSAVSAVAYCAATSVASIPSPLNARDAFLKATREVVSPEPAQEREATVLKPIHPSVFDSAVGIGARDMIEFDSLPPATQAQMVFGSPGSNGQMHLANMTLYAADGLPIVMMEKFEGLTSAVDCEGDDGQMSLTFRSQEAYDRAIESWMYINEETDLQFLMVTNHDGCGPEEERQVYRITDVDNRDPGLKVVLSATPAPWKEIAGNFDLDFGKARLTNSARRALHKRGWLDWVDDAADAIGDTFNDVVDAIAEVGDGELSKSVDIPVSVGEEGVETLLFEDYTTNPPQLKLYCSNCFISGTFQTTGSLKVENFIPQSLQLEVKPQDFGAALELKAEVAKANPAADWLEWEKTLFEAAIPGAGIVIPKVLTLGAKFEFKISGKASVIGRATITVGASTSLPNGAAIAVDMIDYENSYVNGFSDINFDPVFDVDKASITANLAVGPKMALVLGVEVLDDTGIEASLSFGTPTFNLNATAGYDENGFCDNSTSTTGVEVVSAANFDMSLGIEGEVDGDKHSFYNRKLVNIPLASFLDKCWDLGGEVGDDPADDPEEEPTVETPPTDAYPSDVYFREDCNSTTNGTASGLTSRAPTCTPTPVVKFSCKDYPNACKSMCFSRYCKGGAGAYPNLLHRGATGSAGVRRKEGGYLAPSRSNQPCNPSNNVPTLFNEVPSWTSMDEFAMALMTEGGRHGKYGAGFRCISQSENSGAGAKMNNLLNVAGITGSNTASSSNAFDIEFTDTDYVDEDYCDTDDKGQPLSMCVNDGYQFVGKWTGSGNKFDYVKVKDGLGWTGPY
ncbi:hypothetical protein FQN54_008528 [Arachnomyces sp. PD_36]|nr:hypothetical protein FQN54_008528 [Arachnomyces sp. PD_36]